MDNNEPDPVTLERALVNLAATLFGWVATIGVTVIIIRYATNPDASKTLAMRSARRGEQFAMRQAQAWANVATACDTAYNKARSGVTV